LDLQTYCEAGIHLLNPTIDQRPFLRVEVNGGFSMCGKIKPLVSTHVLPHVRPTHTGGAAIRIRDTTYPALGFELITSNLLFI
jgi:hypothetical protein